MEKINEIVLTNDVWEDRFEEALGKQLMILLKQGEICCVYDDSEGIVVIQHDHNNDVEDWGGNSLMWVSEEEKEMILGKRYEEENKEEFEEEMKELEDFKNDK